MAGIGQSDPPKVAPGAAEIAKYQAAGFTPQEIAKYQADKTQTYLHAGFSPSEVDAYWGVKTPHSPEIDAHVANNVRKAGVTEADGPPEAFAAGWGTSVAGIGINMATGHDPNKAFQVKPPEGLINGVVYSIGQQLGDAGTSILGFMGGAAAGAAIPGVGETGVGEVIGGVAGAAGMGIASQGTREILLNAYNRDQIHSFSDFLHILGGSVTRTLTAGAETAPFGLMGPIGSAAAKAGAGKVASAGIGIGGATALGVSTGAYLDGRHPDGKDFVLAAATMLVAHGAIKAGAVVKGVFRPSAATLNVQHNLEQIYRRDGITPWEAINLAKGDAGMRQEIMQQDVSGNSVAPRMHGVAPQEPPPIEHKAAEAGPPMKQARVTPKAAPIVTSFEDLSTALEGSRDDSVSPAGAIGKHQIMLGTARQYGFGEGMSQSELAKWLHDPTNNATVFGKIAADLHARFHGDMNAMLIAYNAGPGRAGEYLTKGPGTELEAIPDKKARGGIRYESRPSHRDESWLPMETQKYLANGRRRSGGATADSGTGLTRYPSWENRAEGTEEAARMAAGGGGSGKPPDDQLLLPGPGEPGDRAFWDKMSWETKVDEIMANVGEPKGSSGWLDLLSPDTLRTQMLSELTPAYNIDSDLVKAGLLDRAKDVGQTDMFRQTYASDTRAGAFVRFGILRIGLKNEITVEPNSPSMMRAVDAIHEDGGDMRGWVAYMLSQRTVDKGKQGVQTGFNPSAAESLITDAEARMYRRGTKLFNDVMTGGLEYARDSGYLSQGMVDAMVRDNPAYISMRRIMGDDVSFGTGRRGFVPREALRKMEGSDRQIVDPLHATIDNLRVLISMADRNRAIGSVIGQVEAGQLQNLGLKRLKFDPKATISAAEGDPFKPYGMMGDNGGPPLDDPAVTYEPLLAERKQKGLAPNEFIYYRNGVPERWSAKSPELADLIRKAATPGEANIVGKVFDSVAKLDRAGIVLSPAFPVRVSFINELTAFVADPLHPPPFITMLRGIHDAFTEKGVYQEWVANGGAGSALADMDVKWLQRDMESVFNDQGVNARLWNRMKHPIEAAQWISERMDAASRIGYYKMAKGKGLSPMKAAMGGRTAYLDFGEKAALEAVNSLARKVPFMRSSLLGADQIIKAFAERPLETLAYIGVAESFTTAVLYAANYLYDKHLPEGHEGEKFAAIDRWILDSHHVTPPIAGARIEIPRIPLVGPLFGGGTNRFLDWWLKNDPHAFDGWAHDILGSVDPRNLLPQAIKTPIEMSANYNFFAGHPIVPASVQAADGYMQYTNATTEPAKALSKLLGPKLNLADFSPIQLEYFLRGTTGNIGIGILKAVNGRMTDYQPPWQMADIPLVGAFFVRHPDTQSQQIEDFYADLKKMEAAHADWSLALKHMDEGEIAMAAKGPFFGLRVVGQMEKSLKVLSAAIVATNKNTELQPAEKSQAVDQMVSAMIQISVMGSGITAEMQGEEPSQAFKDMDKNKAWQQAVSVSFAGDSVGAGTQ